MFLFSAAPFYGPGVILYSLPDKKKWFWKPLDYILSMATALWLKKSLDILGNTLIRFLGDSHDGTYEATTS